MKKGRSLGPTNVVAPFALAVFALAAACRREPEIIRIDGSTGVMPLVTAITTEYRARNPSTVIVMGVGLGSAARIQALADGTIEVALASHGVDSAEIQRRGMAMHEVARTAVVFGVNSGVAVAGLTQRQICDIYSGAVTNWRELGGPDLPIRAGIRPRTEVDAEAAFAEIQCLRALKPGRGVQMIERPADMATAIAATPGAIGLTSQTAVEQSAGRIRALQLDGVAPSPENVVTGKYPLSRKVILVTKARPSRGVRHLLEYMRDSAGERVIRANGAIPTRDRPH